jgi:hypothetical protein
MVMEGEWFALGTDPGAKIMTASFRKIALSTLAALTLATTLAATGAEARPRFHRGHGWGIGAGIAALAVGGLIASQAYAEPVYEEDAPVRRCDMVERVNRFGEVVGYRKVCSLY